MDTKNVLYAAVGAPIAAAKTLNSRIETLRSELENRTSDLTTTAQKRIEEWSQEGREVVNRVSDGKMVDDFAAKVDFDQARDQVIKLRDQLEDMLATWRTSFRPADEAAKPATEKVTTAAQSKTATSPKAPAAKKPAAKAPAKKAPAAKKPATKAPAKKSPTKSTTAKNTTTKNTTAAKKAPTTKAASASS